jgi:hypothetical protein
VVVFFTGGFGQEKDGGVERVAGERTDDELDLAGVDIGSLERFVDRVVEGGAVRAGGGGIFQPAP